MAGACRSRRRDERGAVALIAGLVSGVLLMVSAFVVDIGGTWLRRGQLQVQADKAALFAAQELPATDELTRLRVAKRVAYYIACHPVFGQRDLNVAIPACPSGPSDDSLTTYAQILMNTGLVSFPTSTQVQVITPDSSVRFAFAGAVGVEDTVQRKTAVAKVSSPGELLPVGLSLQCLAGIVNNAGLGSAVDGLLPLSYITPGAASAGTSLPTDAEPVFSGWSSTYSGTNASANVTVSNPSLVGTTLTLSVSSPGLLPTLNGLLGGNEVVFQRGSTVVGPVAASSLDLVGGTLVVALPTDVANTPGVWHVKVKLFTGSLLNLGIIGTNAKWSSLDTTVTIMPATASVLDRVRSQISGVLDLKNFLACGRLLDSPRPVTGGTPPLTFNLQEGLDHALTPNAALLQLLGGQSLPLNGSASALTTALGTTVSNVLANPAYGLLGCVGSLYNRLDTGQTWAAVTAGTASPANCVRVGAGPTTEQEFTDGLLKDTPANGTTPGYGRLSCQRSGACPGDTVTLPGFTGSYNNDAFGDFVKGGSSTLLDSNLAFALDTYLLPGVPVVTPSDRLEERLYASPRFGWAPVLSGLDLNGATADSPILTFRPVFLDNGEADDLSIAGLTPTKVVDGLGSYLAQAVSGAVEEVRTSLGILSSALDLVLDTLGLGSVLTSLGGGDVNGALGALGTTLGLDLGEEKAGLVLQDGTLKAARFMTIAPDALPAVSQDYDGPVSDYVGVGPKIIRLVR